jgi:signal transduction histidine kinase
MAGHQRKEESVTNRGSGTTAGRSAGAGAAIRPSALTAALRAIVSPVTWLAVVHLLAGLVVGIVTFTIAVTGLSLGIGLLAVFLLGIPVLLLTLWMCDQMARAERARFSFLLGADIAAPAPSAIAPSGWRRLSAPFLARSSWKHAGYALVRLPLSVLDVCLVTVVWSLAIALLTLPAYNAALPGGSAHLGNFAVRDPWPLAALTLAGLLLLLAAPWLTRALAALDVSVAQALLGTGRRADLTARIGELEISRAAVVDAAEVERRRIERDLHDGAQQRLVSLAMELGRARTKFATDPAGAQAIVDQAHEQAKEALTELRNLVRGVHPPVLSDRGLDAALSGLAALSPVPVTVTVEVPVRPPAKVEAIAYFVVAEALTNIAKHSRASQASLSVSRSGDLLMLTITDDGVGGANTAGLGLSGLAARVAGVDGRLSVSSPAGGPTVIEVALPCG